jgi:predicted unusual protein kinase regulating ubiquinone biosynthesis (AarF/ABC1/UbiB family)
MLRLLQILYVFAFYLLFHPSKSFGERLRLALERLGLVFIKIGQILAARQFFSGSSQKELEKLWDNTSPLSFSVIEPIVVRAIGQSIDTYFDSFEEEAYASASIAQTHIAYREGRKVMVKVRRPDVLGKMQQDLHIAKDLVGFGAIFSRPLWCIKSARIVEQLETWLLQEVDLRNEQKNAEMFREGYKDGCIIVPEILFASEELLVEQFLEGVPCNRWEEHYRAEGYDPQESVRSFFLQTFTPPFRGIPVPVHGDPHPANLIIMKDGKMGVVDYGRVGMVTKHDLKLLNDILDAIYTGNPELTIEAVLRMGNMSLLQGKRRVAFDKDITNYVKECRDQSFDYWLVEMSRIQLRHGIPSPDTFTLIACFAILSNRVGQLFFPDSSAFDLVGPEIREGMIQQMMERISHIDPIPFLYELSLRSKDAPVDAAKVLQDPLAALTEVSEAWAAPLKKNQEEKDSA